MPANFEYTGHGKFLNKLPRVRCINCRKENDDKNVLMKMEADYKGREVKCDVCGCKWTIK